MKVFFRLIVVLAAILLPAINANAKKPIEGSWIKTAVNGKNLPEHVVCIKTIRPDHSFVHVESTDGGNLFRLVNSGQWQSIAEGVYMETVTAADPMEYKNLNVPISYTFGKNGTLTIRYIWGGMATTELWTPYKPRK